MQRNFQITPRFAIKTLLFMVLGVLSFLLGFSNLERLATLSRYEISHILFYVVMGFGAFVLIQVAVGVFWKQARQWGMLAFATGGVYILIATMLSIETRSPRAILYVLGGTVVATLSEVGIGFLIKKYERVMRIVGQIILTVIVGYIAFMLGYSCVQNERDTLYITLRHIRSGVVFVLEALTLGLIVLGIWKKSIRKWGLLAFLTFLGIATILSGQVGSYVLYLIHHSNLTNYAFLGLFVFLLLQILVGLIWKPARKWKLLATSTGILFVSVFALICTDGRSSFMPMVYILLATSIAMLLEMGIAFLMSKYGQGVHLFVKIGLFLIVGLVAFLLGYGDTVVWNRILTTFRNIRSVLFVVLGSLTFGFVVLGALLKSMRKWEPLAGLLIFSSVIAVFGQVVDYMSVTRYCDEMNVSDADGGVFKPIIYLYPQKTTMVTVQMGRPENLTYTYPVYQNEWLVKAMPDGTLTDPQTKRTYYALYWEGKAKREKQKLTEGFVVSAEETIPFLEEKLKMLGLTEREANEFIVYWLPKLGEYKYNFIRFQTQTEQNENMPLNVTPEPNTVIRVMMEYRGLNKPISVFEQQLEQAPARKGFTLVEWGGTPI